jgi:hypothetical protein
MRIALASPVVLAVLLIAPEGGGAAGGPRLSASPDPVRFGETLVVKGRGWPRIEFCKRRVRLSLRSDQNAFPIGRAKIRDDRRFIFRYPVSASNVGRGDWTLRAKLPCESGDDGSPNPVVRTRGVRIR